MTISLFQQEQPKVGRPGMKKIIKALLRDDRGATAIEMGLICALIVLAMLTALQDFAAGSIAMWDNVATKSADAMGGPAS
jgi:pilus assembly protein Flp/PilA